MKNLIKTKVPSLKAKPLAHPPVCSGNYPPGEFEKGKKGKEMSFIKTKK